MAHIIDDQMFRFNSTSARVSTLDLGSSCLYYCYIIKLYNINIAFFHKFEKFKSTLQFY